jgi:NAD(P)-dependent dehydrogenase (short-subunit alcohol dehydrogenase family)
LAREGGNVIVHGRSKEHNRGTLAALKEYKVSTDSVEGELSNVAEVERLIRVVLDAHGGVDILYNNAAIQGNWKEIWDTAIDDWQAVIQVNLFSMVLLSTAFARGMKARGYGRIINLTSGIKGTPQLSPYSVSKAAVNKFTQDLAFELRGTGVLVNYLDPGWLKTDMAGPGAEFEVETVLPGALVPVLLENNGPTGIGFRAQEYRERKDLDGRISRAFVRIMNHFGLDPDGTRAEFMERGTFDGYITPSSTASPPR